MKTIRAGVLCAVLVALLFFCGACASPAPQAARTEPQDAARSQSAPGQAGTRCTAKKVPVIRSFEEGALWGEPEGELCPHCKMPVTLRSDVTPWWTPEVSVCPEDWNYNDRCQQRQVLQSVICERHGEFAWLVREQTVTQTRVLCAHD